VLHALTAEFSWECRDRSRDKKALAKLAEEPGGQFRTTPLRADGNRLKEFDILRPDRSEDRPTLPR
jgi:hypothetical protein